ncbi:HAMP domain-containing protein [Sediminibacterium roseum]|uniref:histidine kinase n=1 Tax=Sediminibacterium roseum TaxID=1978412 RepID=A0ABW9ZY94_9BACT|nr:ATP-binding protein [Sediminibacterium roseum]NCI52029.1 HAMP domain-containing protein [Sediminibacterium roseum]
MKLKTKITLGVMFLFTLLLLVGGTGFFYLNRSTSEQRDILKENYETLDYTKGMLEAMDNRDTDPEGKKAMFEQNMRGQESNITEPGEEYVTRKLRRDFNALQDHPGSLEHEKAVRNDISAIMQINLLAISEKNKMLNHSSDSAKFIITLLLTLCAIVGLVFVYNFPGYIANPIVTLTEGIKAIAGKKYSERIHLNRKDEFGEMAAAFNNMAEELDKFEHSNLARILFEKQRAEAVINSLQDASIGIGKNGTILFANPQALQLLNLPETAVIGKKEKLLREQNDLFRFLMTEESDQPFKIVVDTKEQFFTKETIPINNSEGTIGQMTVLKNITPYKELDVAKTNFMATVSHELKTPLAASDFSLKLLEDERVGPLNTEQKELVQNLKADNQRLLKILSELLDLSQVESGKIQLHIKEIDASVPVKRAVEAVTAAAQQKQVLIDTLLAHQPLLCKADEEKVAWVLTNLLTNAIKYSPAGSTVTVQVSRETDTMVISVTDRGKGIGHEHLARIFDRFYQVPGTEKTGTGLGLSISKEFIEAMGGKAWVESELGQGSRFYFSLPLA